MNKLLSLVVVFIVSCVASAQAMPVVPLGPQQAGLTTQVSSGCGLGVHRGPFNGCAPVYVYGGYDGGYYRGYRDAQYDGPYVRFHDNGGVVEANKGICGFGSYLACGYGTCWRFCY